MGAPRVLLTIDVEEDMPGWEIRSEMSTRNAEALPRLAEMCREIGILPTYLCDYPMVTLEPSRSILKELFAAGGCEVGTHLHAWNTPPFEGLPGRPGVDEQKLAYYQFELGAAGFRKKLEVLHAAITELCDGREPISFRSGRFGLDEATLGVLLELGYQVDSSVTPLQTHEEDGGPDFRWAPQVPYRPSRESVVKRGDMQIVEIPVSVALTRKIPNFLRHAYVALPPATRLRGLLSRDYLNLVDFAWLYPVRFDVELMKGAAKTLRRIGSPVLNVFLHSSELVAGASGRVQTEADVEQVFERLRGILEHCVKDLGAIPATLGAMGPEMAGWIDSGSPGAVRAKPHPAKKP